MLFTREERGDPLFWQLLCLLAAAVQGFRAAGLDVTFDGETGSVRKPTLRNPLEARRSGLMGRQQNNLFLVDETPSSL